MKIKIYGTGCAKCHQLADTVASVIADSGADAEVEKVTDINAIVARGVMMTPALEADGEIVSSGRLPDASEIRKVLGVPCCSCGSSCGCSCGSEKKRWTFRNWIGLALVAFALAAIGLTVVKEWGENGNTAMSQPTVEAAVAKGPVTVYYFHGTRRCMTCNSIEALTRSTVETVFADAVKSGGVIIRSVNLDAAENEHFITDFELTSRIVVVSKGDRFERLHRVWELVHDEPKFREYVTDGVRKLL